jgi:hypothetical protein
MVGATLLTSCHVLNIVPMKNKEKTPYEKWFERKSSLSYLRTWGCLAKVNVPINKKRKLGPKNMDCIFLGYAHHSIAYSFLVIKLEVLDVYVDTFLESCNVTFFENIFLMKNSHSMSRLPENVIADTTSEPSKNFVHTEHALEPVHEEIDGEAPRRSKRQMAAKSLVMISLFISWMTLLKPFQRHLHLQMQMIGKKWSVVRWTQFSSMELGS